MEKGKIFKWLVIALAVVVLMGVIGGGIVYATTTALRAGESTNADTGVITAVTQADDDEPEPGIVIAAVDAGGPAATAGVVRGDILLAIDGEPVTDYSALRQLLADREAGDQVQLNVLHGDDERSLTATLAEQNGATYLGIVPCGGSGGLGRLVDELPRLRGFLEGLPHEEGLVRVPEAQGAMIIAVVPDSPADEAGLKEGDRIVAVDDQAVDAENSLADLVAARNPGVTVTLKVERGEDEVLELTAQLGPHPENEEVAYLGVQYGPLPRIRMFQGDGSPLDEGEVPVGGGIITRVDQDSPADVAGLKVGDRITKIDGEELSLENDLQAAIAERQPGDKVTLEIERPGEEEPIEVAVELGAHPEKAGVAYLGISVLPFQGFGQLGENFGLDELPFGEGHFQLPFEGEIRQGAIVRNVTENSPAAVAGLTEGDLITEIDGEPVAGPQDLVDAIADYAPGDQVTLTVLSQSEEEERLVTVTLGEHPEQGDKAYLGVSVGGFFLRRNPGGNEEGIQGIQPLREFLERFQGQSQPSQDDGVQFRGWSLEDLDNLPFDLDQLPFDFDFGVPPRWFEQVPVQPEQEIL